MGAPEASPGTFDHSFRLAEGATMRAIGLAAILLSSLFFLFPWYREWVPVIDMTNNDTRLVAGLLLAVGALTLAVYRR